MNAIVLPAVIDAALATIVICVAPPAFTVRLTVLWGEPRCIARAPCLRPESRC